MPPRSELDPSFVFEPLPAIPEPPAAEPAPGSSPLGPLELLEGCWTGNGFNTIWRPNFPKDPQDRFLELNLTTETLVFSHINGAIPNRGLLQEDINMFGLTYIQQISDSTDNAGLHIEPGIWAVVPETTNPVEPPTVVRMASIPHGTTIVAQGKAFTVAGPPRIDDNNIIPFGLNGAPPQPPDFKAAEAIFTELDLSIPTKFRSADNPGILQSMVENPNSVLQAAIAGQTFSSTTVLVIATDSTPVPGGGTANTAFLHGGPDGPNANATVVSAIFWIESVVDPAGGPDTLQLQYTQTVMLDFNGLRWPHVTVATLRKSPAA
jgi:hypothetical protein